MDSNSSEPITVKCSSCQHTEVWKEGMSSCPKCKKPYPLVTTRFVHEYNQQNSHRINRIRETLTTEKIGNGEWTPPTEIAVVFDGDVIYVGITPHHADKWPQLDPSKVHQFTYSKSYGEGDVDEH